MADFTGLIVPIGTSMTTTTISSTAMFESVALAYSYTDICTNFNHDPSATTFTGQARLQGGSAFAIGFYDSFSSFSPSSLGAAPSLVMSITSAIYDPLNSLALFVLTGVLTDNAYPEYTRPDTPLTVGIQGTASFATPDVCVGTMHAALFHSGTVLPSPLGATFTLTRGGTCPV